MWVTERNPHCESVCPTLHKHMRAPGSACLLFVIPKQQNQNTSLHTWELDQWALSCFWPPAQCPDHLCNLLGGILQQVCQEQCGWGSVSLSAAEAARCASWCWEPGNFPLSCSLCWGTHVHFPPSGLLGLWSDVAVPQRCFPINHRPAAKFWVGVWLWEFMQALLGTREALLLPLLCCSVAGSELYIVAGIGIHICSQHMLLAQYQQMLLSGIGSRGAALLWSVTLWNGTMGFLLAALHGNFSLTNCKMLLVCF